MDIHIDWEGPLTLSQAKELHSSSDYGIYQYYGDHLIYGTNVLLYIGKTVKQKFGDRLSQHNWPAWIPSKTELYVGRICTTEKIEFEEWEQKIDIAERILIFSHSPAFNAANLNNINYKKLNTFNDSQDVRVMNWGKRKSLLPEVSVSRWESGLTLGHKKPEGFKVYTNENLIKSSLEQR